MEEVPRRERKSNKWIRGGTWRILDQHSSLRKQSKLSMAQGRCLGRRIGALFQSNRDYCAIQAGHAVMANLKDDKVKAAWGNLRAWHKEVDPAASKPCYAMRLWTGRRRSARHSTAAATRLAPPSL